MIPLIPINHSLKASKKQWQMHLNVLQNSEEEEIYEKIDVIFLSFSLPFFTEFLPIPVQPPTEVLQRQTGLSPNAQALFQFILFNIFCQMDVPNNRGYLESKSFSLFIINVSFRTFVIRNIQLIFTQTHLSKGQANWLPQASIFGSIFQFAPALFQFILFNILDGDAEQQRISRK